MNRWSLALILLALALPVSAQGDYARYLSVKNVQFTQDDAGNVTVTGTVVNRGPGGFTDVRLDCTGYDGGGYPIMETGGSVQNVEAGGSAPFQIDDGAPNRVHRVEVTVVGGSTS